MTAVYVSVDMEGVAGVSSLHQLIRGRDDYPAARLLMTEEANAAVAGAFDAGATRVIVNDSHGDMSNVLPDLLDGRAELVQGSPKLPWGMMQLVDDGLDIALFVGYHAAAGTSGAMFEHTLSGATYAEVRVNGETWGEAEINAAVAGSLGVPVGLVCGDDVTCAQVSKRLPGLVTVVTKRALGKRAGSSIHPVQARTLIRAGATQAVECLPTLRPWRPEAPYAIEAEFKDSLMAEMCANMPGADRVGPRTAAFVATDIRELRRCLSSWAAMAPNG